MSDLNAEDRKTLEAYREAHAQAGNNVIARYIDQLEEALRDEALAFNHANEIVGKQEAELASLREENERLKEKIEREAKEQQRLDERNDAQGWMNRALKAEAQLAERQKPVTDEEWMLLKILAPTSQFSEREALDALLASRHPKHDPKS